MQAAEDAEIRRQLEEGPTLFGTGWRCVDSLEEVDGEFESDEEEEYIVMDLGTAMDARTLQTEATYQLIGMDTPMPFLKIGEHVFQGAVAPLIGDEVIFDVERQEDDPQRPHHRPAHKTTHRVELHAVGLTRRPFPQRALQPKHEDVEMSDGGPIGLTADMVLAQAPELGTPVAGPSRIRARHLQSLAAEAQLDSPMVSPSPASKPATPVAAPPSSPPLAPFVSVTPADGAEGPETSPKRRIGRPRGSVTRTTLPIRTINDLTDINHAGGLGEVRLEIAEDATPELLAAVSAVRGKPSGPGAKLSRAQEERLVRGLPAAGPGSRGGRGSRIGTRGRGSRGGTTKRGRPRGRGGIVPPSGEGLADGFLGVAGDDEYDDGDEEGTATGTGTGTGTPAEGTEAGPSRAEEDGDYEMRDVSVAQHVRDSDDELREIGDDE